VAQLTPFADDEEFHPEFKLFMRMINKRLPKIKWGYWKRPVKAGFSFGSNYIYRTVCAYAYYPGDIHAIARIDYADPTKTGPVKNLYCVYSSQIDNGKYSHGDGQFMAATADIDRAVRNFAKLRRIRPEVSLTVIAKKAFTLIRQHQNDLSVKISTACNTAWNSYNMDSLAAKELVHAYKSGYTFTNPEMRDRVAAVINAKEEYDNMVAKDTQWFCVKLTETEEDGPIVIYIKMGVQGEPKDWEKRFNLEGDAEIRSPQIVPMALQKKLALLNMVEDEQYVPGVGVRLTSENFFVLADEPLVEIYPDEEPAVA
jgi:hypothetical protein